MPARLRRVALVSGTCSFAGRRPAGIPAEPARQPVVDRRVIGYRHLHPERLARPRTRAAACRATSSARARPAPGRDRPAAARWPEPGPSRRRELGDLLVGPGAQRRFPAWPGHRSAEVGRLPRRAQRRGPVPEHRRPVVTYRLSGAVQSGASPRTATRKFRRSCPARWLTSARTSQPAHGVASPA